MEKLKSRKRQSIDSLFFLSRALSINPWTDTSLFLNWKANIWHLKMRYFTLPILYSSIQLHTYFSIKKSNFEFLPISWFWRCMNWGHTFEKLHSFLGTKCYFFLKERLGTSVFFPLESRFLACRLKKASSGSTESSLLFSSC